MLLRKKSSKRKRKGVGSSGYAYTNTRIRVRKTRLLQKQDYERMMLMSLPEIVRFLQDSEYKSEISELAVKHSGVSLVEYALNKNLENTFTEILRFAIRDAREQIKNYLRKHDVNSIKAVLRGKHTGKSNEEILNEIVSAGEFDKSFFEKALEKSSNLSEAINAFQSTEYFEVLDENREKSLDTIEDSLDKFYYNLMLEKSERELMDYIKTDIWIKNTLNELRARKAELKLELIPGGKPEKIRLPKEEDCIETRIALRRFLIKRAVSMLHEFKRNFQPVLGYLVSKENEIANIRIIARGKNVGLGKELIGKQLVA